MQIRKNRVELIRPGGDQVSGDLFPIEVLAGVKRLAGHGKEPAPRGFHNYPGRRKILERFVGDDSRIGPSHGHITQVGGGAAEISDFAGKVDPVVAMEARVGEN